MDRRALLGGAAATVPLLGAAAAGNGRSVAADLDRYIGFGGKATGGGGDLAAGEWLAGELRQAGYAVTRQPIEAPYFTSRTATLSTGAATAAVVPQAVVVPTGPGGIRGKILRTATERTVSFAGAIAIVELPYNRWSSALTPTVRSSVAAAFTRGAAAVVIVTTGPTGEAIALNAPASAQLSDRPVAVLAPRDAAPFLFAADRSETGSLIVDGEAGRRASFNLVGRIDRGRERWLIVSTPRSGWFTCAGERGGGVAAWLALARWAATALPDHDLVFACASGHEYEYLGAEAALRAGVYPPPNRTSLWLHLGANVAARDWQELTGTLRPLPSADTQRYLMISDALMPAARRSFAGIAGLEAPLAIGPAGAGELVGIVAAGYPRVAGIFGAHRFHHCEADDARCVAPPLVQAALTGCCDFVRAALA